MKLFAAVKRPAQYRFFASSYLTTCWRPRTMATQPPWTAPPPPSEDLPDLRVYNSLTRTKTPFSPIAGRKINWYACGPTVYDDSHLGHARNYMTQDVLRRIMQDYFRFDVNFVMNITDVDDKIILAARQQYLLAQWLEKHRRTQTSSSANSQPRARVDTDTRQTTEKALQAYVKKNLPLLDPELDPVDFSKEVDSKYGHVLQGKSVANDGTPAGDKEAKIKMHINTARAAAEAQTMSDSTFDQYEKLASGVLLPYIDSLHSSTVRGTDHHIFTALTNRYETRFFEDMEALNVRYPDQLTRVTEYGPQIVEFVKRIQDNGFAYEHEGSIYYDINAWEAKGGFYARLEPWNRHDKELQADGEGSLVAKNTGFKRSPADFVLWKASKTGEPSWSSPWGEGRPGWHIECSAMASDILGKQFDIHSGGIDLAFPHHDNELAQAEAYWCNHADGKVGTQWVNYFLHMGHLSISGSKMSKSLKNFTTIRQALSEGAWTPRGLRIVFLLGNWRDGLEITPDVVKAGLAWEERVTNFFIKVRDVQSRQQHSNGHSKPEETDLDKHLAEAQAKFREALSDSFDTPTSMRVISDLITSYNSAPEQQIPFPTSIAIGTWVTEMVQMFGLDATPPAGQLGWSGMEIPEHAKPFILPLAALRDTVRAQARAGKVELATPDDSQAFGSVDATAQPYANAYTDFQQALLRLKESGAATKEWLDACDHVRDRVLWDLGIYLEDREGGLPALVRPLSQSLRQERTEREALASNKAAAKAKLKAETEAAEKDRLAKGKLSPNELMKATGEFSDYDEEGFPTKDAQGEALTKSRLKKLRKDWERQLKLHEAYAANSGASAT